MLLDSGCAVRIRTDQITRTIPDRITESREVDNVSRSWVWCRTTSSAVTTSAERRTVVVNRTASAEVRQSSAAVGGQPPGAQRDSVGLSKGRAVERTARGLPGRLDVSATPGEVESRRDLEACVVRLSAQSRPSGALELEESFAHARLMPTQGRGDVVGLTKGGRRPQCLVVLDSEGVLVRTAVHSAPPAAGILIEVTLDAIASVEDVPWESRPRLQRWITGQGARLRRAADLARLARGKQRYLPSLQEPHEAQGPRQPRTSSQQATMRGRAHLRVAAAHHLPRHVQRANRQGIPAIIRWSAWSLHYRSCEMYCILRESFHDSSAIAVSIDKS